MENVWCSLLLKRKEVFCGSPKPSVRRGRRERVLGGLVTASRICAPVLRARRREQAVSMLHMQTASVCKLSLPGPAVPARLQDPDTESQAISTAVFTAISTHVFTAISTDVFTAISTAVCTAEPVS